LFALTVKISDKNKTGIHSYEPPNYIGSTFAGLYFNTQNQLQKVAAHDPFDRLIDLEKTGLRKENPKNLKNGSAKLFSSL
jgi:hypothetical protein